MNILKRCAVLLLTAGLLFSVAGCGGGKDTTWVAQLGEDRGSSGLYTLYLMDGYSDAASQITEDVDSILNEKIDGQPVVNYITDYAKKQVNRLLSIRELFAKTGQELTQEEKDEAAAYASYYYTEFQEPYLANGVTQEDMTAMYESAAMTKRVFDSIYGEGGEEEVPREELYQTLKDTYTRSRHIVFYKVDLTTGEALDEAALAERKATAESYYARVNAGENIIDLALEYNNSQLAEGETPEERLEDKYYDAVAEKGTGSLPTVYSEQLEQMEDGAYALVEDDYYYIIIQKLSFDDADQEIVDTYLSVVLQNEKYDAFMEKMDALSERTDVVYNNEALKVYTPKKLNMTNEEITAALIDMGVDVYGSASSDSEEPEQTSSEGENGSSDDADASGAESAAQ